METLMPFVTLAGTIVTTAGTVIVSIITTRNRQETRATKEEVERGRDILEDKFMAEFESIKKELRSNTICNVATARGLISQVYSANKDSKEIPEKTWRNICDLHEAYKSVSIDGHVPNSWCDTMVDEMKTWVKK